MILRHGLWWDCEAAADEAEAAVIAAADDAREPRHDPRGVAETLVDAARAHAECVAAEAAATAAHVEAIARDAARWTRWCASCGVDVCPVYPRERACVRCGVAWPVREERAA